MYFQLWTHLTPTAHQKGQFPSKGSVTTEIVLELVSVVFKSAKVLCAPPPFSSSAALSWLTLERAPLLARRYIHHTFVTLLSIHSRQNILQVSFNIFELWKTIQIDVNSQAFYPSTHGLNWMPHPVTWHPPSVSVSKPAQVSKIHTSPSRPLPCLK